MNRWLLIIGLAWLFTANCITQYAVADVLTIPNINNQPAKSDEAVVRPTRGMTMEEVTAQFGNPNKTYDSVGKPPITRWVYDKFTVYFERNYVIHSVVNRDKQSQ